MSRRKPPHARGWLCLWVIVAIASCSQADRTEVEVEVRNIGMDEVSGSPVVVLQDKRQRLALPIWIGPAEAQAIAVEMQGVKPPRPMTHDLMKNALEEAGVQFDRAVIVELQDATYLAQIHLREGKREFQVDSRPSDAIALAVRFGGPIYVARALLEGDSSIDLRRVLGSEARNLRGITVQPLSQDLAAIFHLPEGRGVLVSGVQNGVAGLHRGDVIVAVDGKAVADVGDLSDKLDAAGAASVDLEVRRGERQLHVALQGEGN